MNCNISVENEKLFELFKKHITQDEFEKFIEHSVTLGLFELQFSENEDNLQLVDQK